MKKYALPGEKTLKKRALVLVSFTAFCLTLAVAPWGRIIPQRPAGDLEEIRSELGQIRGQVEQLNARYAERVTVTCYNSTREQTDSSPRITAINTPCRPGTVAVSRDLLEQGWVFGAKVWIDGLGVYTVSDIMAKGKVRQLDVWQPKRSPAFRYDDVLAVVIR